MGSEHALFAAASPTRVLAVYTRLSVCPTKPRLSHSTLQSIFSLRLWRKFIFTRPADCSCQALPMDMDGPYFANYPKSKFCLLSAIAVMKVAPFNLKQKWGWFSAGVWKHAAARVKTSGFIKSASCFVTRLQQERKQHGESMHPIWRPTLAPVAVAPLSEEKTRDIFFTFKVGWRHIRMRFVSNRRCSLLHLSRDTRGSLRRCSHYCNYFYLFIFLCAAVISGYTVQMNLRLPLWSIMQCHFFRGLLMRSSASFGSTMEIISFFFFV